MPRFTRDPNRLNHTVDQKGKEYNQRLLFRSQAIFTTLLNLLPSNYISTVQGPNYTNELKAVAVELARVELALEDVNDDRAFATTRPEFLYSIVGYLLLLNGRLPPVQFDDEQFRQFLLALVQIYFQGSIPESMADALKLFATGDIGVTENFLLVRRGASGYDISDQFGFQIDVTGESFPPGIFDVDGSLRLILDIIRPAHTLFTIRYVFTDKFLPNQVVERVLDACRWALSAYYYDDFRSNWNGLRHIDRLGQKTNQYVQNEDHSVAMQEPPFLAEFSPGGSLTNESVLLTLYGARFAPGATVTINGLPCGELFITPRLIICTTPLFGAPLSSAVVQVSNPDGQYARRSSFVVSPGGSGIALISLAAMTDDVSIVGAFVYARDANESMGISDTVIAGNIGLPLTVDLSGDTLSFSDSAITTIFEVAERDLSGDTFSITDSVTNSVHKVISVTPSTDSLDATDSVTTDLTVPQNLSDVYGASLAHEWASTYSTDSNGVSQWNDAIGTSHALPWTVAGAPEPILSASGYPTFHFDGDAGSQDRMLSPVDTILPPGGTVAFQVGFVCRIDHLTAAISMMAPTASAGATNNSFLIRNDLGALKVVDITSGAPVDAVASTAFGVNTWHTVVADFRSNNTVRLYVDETYIGSGSINVATVLTRLSRMGFCTGGQTTTATFGSCYIAYSSTDFPLDHTAQTACRVMNAYLGDKSIPNITSLSSTIADAAGGESITLTGTNLGSATACLWDGTACTITNNTSTSLTFTTPAKAAGTYFVRVVTPGGASTLQALDSWSRTAWWRAPYTAGADWISFHGVAAAAGVYPAAGPTLNTLTTADFNGSTHHLNITLPGSPFATGGSAAGTAWCLFWADSAPVDVANYYSNGVMVGASDGSASWALAISDAGFMAGALLNGSYRRAITSCSTGAWHLGMARISVSTGIQVRVDSGAWTTPVPNAGSQTFTGVTGVRMGANYVAGIYFDGKVAEWGADDVVRTDAECDRLKAAINARYGLSL